MCLAFYEVAQGGPRGGDTHPPPAFRLIPLHPSQYHLTGFKWKNEYYFDRCLPQGCSSSCKIFEKFSTAIAWLLKTKLNVKNLVKVIVDFLFIAGNSEMCGEYLGKFLALCCELKIPTAPHKTFWPCNIIVFLGIELNSITVTALLPQEKITVYSQCIKETLGKKNITLRELNSLIGKLQFATSVVLPGRAFLRRMHDLIIGITKPYYFVRLYHEVKQDLQTWLDFLLIYNDKTIITQPSRSYSSYLHMLTDASKMGFGATYGSYWIQCRWPINWQKLNIAILEIYPIYVLISMFGNKLQNSRIMFHCDNEAVVPILNSQTSKNKIIMSIVRKIVLVLLKYNLQMKVKHIPGINNTLCDAIS